jgi:hypothetical protein
VAKKRSVRVMVSEKNLRDAMTYFYSELQRRIEQKGQYSHIGPHESLGLITEEYHELIMAIHHNDGFEFGRELTDIAVGCIFGLASHFARTKTDQSTLKVVSDYSPQMDLELPPIGMKKKKKTQYYPKITKSDKK